MRRKMRKSFSRPMRSARKSRTKLDATRSNSVSHPLRQRTFAGSFC
jgi:hypothetical protein